MKQIIHTFLLLSIYSGANSQDLSKNVEVSSSPITELQAVIVKDTSWVSDARTQRLGGIDRSGTFTTIAGYKISNVEFKCNDSPSVRGGACPWNYNPSGGYSKNIVINQCGASARWLRRYDGASCTQRYTITFTKIEVEKFWRDNLRFLTDGGYNRDSKVFIENTSSVAVVIRYKVEYSIGGEIKITDCNVISVRAYSKQFLGPKYINNDEGSFLVSYELIEAPFK